MANSNGISLPFSRFCCVFYVWFFNVQRVHNFAEIITFGLWLKIKVNRNLVFISFFAARNIASTKKAAARALTQMHTQNGIFINYSIIFTDFERNRAQSDRAERSKHFQFLIAYIFQLVSIAATLTTHLLWYFKWFGCINAPYTRITVDYYLRTVLQCLFICQPYFNFVLIIICYSFCGTNVWAAAIPVFPVFVL